MRFFVTLGVMSKNQNKTKPTKASVENYLKSITDEAREKDCRAIAAMMEKATKEKPQMWGKSIVGFGTYHYTYASGREGDWMRMGFSSRKDAISIYLMCDLDRLKSDLKDLGTHKRGVGCLYIKSLDAIDVRVLKRMIIKSAKSEPVG